jgi:hypothetical protein
MHDTIPPGAQVEQTAERSWRRFVTFLLSGGRHPILVILAVAFVLRIVGIKYNLLPFFTLQPDEENVVVRALRFGHGDLNPHWFLYPTFFLYIAFGAYAFMFALGHLTGIFASVNAFANSFFRDPTVFYLIPRTISAICGTLTVLLVYLITQRLTGNRRTAVFSAACLTVSVSHVRESHSAKPDAVMIFLTVLSFLLALSFLRTNKRSFNVFAGIIAGLAISTKYTAGVIVVALLIVHLFNDNASWYQKSRNALACVAFIVIGFLIGTPYAAIDWRTFLDWFGWVHRHKQIVWANQEFANLSGYAYYAFHAWPESMGIFVALLSLAGIFLLLGTNIRACILLLVFPLATYAYLGSSTLFLSNFFTPCVPFLAIFAGVAIDSIVKRIRNTAMCIVAVALLLVPSLASTLKLLHQFVALDTGVVTKYWVELHLPCNSRIVSVRIGPPLNLTKERIDEILTSDAPTMNSLKGFTEKDTGQGRYYRYLRDNPASPAYYQRVIPDLPTNGNDTVRGLDFSLYTNYDFVIIASTAQPERGGAAIPVTVQTDTAKQNAELANRYFSFIQAVRENCSLMEIIDGNYMFDDITANPLQKMFFDLWGRRGQRFEIYRVSKKLDHNEHR